MITNSILVFACSFIALIGVAGFALEERAGRAHRFLTYREAKHLQRHAGVLCWAEFLLWVALGTVLGRRHDVDPSALLLIMVGATSVSMARTEANRLGYDAANGRRGRLVLFRCAAAVFAAVGGWVMV